MFLWLLTESAAFIRPISQCRRVDRFAPNRSTKADTWLGQSWVILDQIGRSGSCPVYPNSDRRTDIPDRQLCAAMNRQGANYAIATVTNVQAVHVLQAYEGVSSLDVREGSAAIRCVTFGLPRM